MPPSVPELTPGQVLAAHYSLEQQLGTGPLGATWLARDTAANRKVVVKVLSSPSPGLEAIKRSEERLRAVGSDALVKVLDSGEHEGHPFIVLEYVEGESLRELMDHHLRERKSFSLQEAAQLVARVLEAADAAHRAGMVHRHLKPGNVIVQTRQVGPGKVIRTIRVTGLGLSELAPAAALQEAIAETPDSRYLAPELSSPNAGGTAQSDVYSAGVIFYELLCGQTPHGTYLAPSQIRDDVPKQVDDVVDIALAANAEDRYPSARDMINDIQRSFQEEGPAATGVSARAVAGLLGAVVVVAALIGGVLYVTNPDRKAQRADAALRAQVVAENPLPDEATIKQKLAGREEMVYIPPGSFIQGRMNAEPVGKLAAPTEPLAQVTKAKGFFIDRFEGENQKGGHPTVNITYADAVAACASRGKRLCTAEEWERACKGPESLVYGYGDTFDPAKCGADTTKDRDRDGKADDASGARPECKSGWGVYDMAGGAREWTSTADKSDPRFRVVKGGKPGNPDRGSRCAFVDARAPTTTDRTISYRCCIGEDEPLVVPGGAPATPPAGETPAPAGTP